MIYINILNKFFMYMIFKMNLLVVLYKISILFFIDMGDEFNIICVFFLIDIGFYFFE